MLVVDVFFLHHQWDDHPKPFPSFSLDPQAAGWLRLGGEAKVKIYPAKMRILLQQKVAVQLATSKLEPSFLGRKAVNIDISTPTQGYIRTYLYTYIRTYVHMYIRTYVHTYMTCIPRYLDTHIPTDPAT